MIRRNKEIIPLPYPVYLGTVLLLCAAGLLDAVYLAISHYRVYTDMGYRSFCAISRAINCDTVSQSPYSIFLNLPVAVWGMVGYLVLLLAALFAAGRSAGRQRMWTFLFYLSILYSMGSILLALVSALYIHSYCIMCILTYGINFFLVYFTWLTRKRFYMSGGLQSALQDLRFLFQRKVRSAAAVLLICFVLLAAYQFIPEYWNLQSPEIAADVKRGVDAAGHPWIGADQPVLAITEFVDYQCFQCKKMHFYLRELVNRYPDKIRLIHRHFPMDHRYNPIVNEPFHLGSGKMAMMAIYAAAKRKFWTMNDLLFHSKTKDGLLDISGLAEKCGISTSELAESMSNPRIRRFLKRDIAVGIRQGVTGTPAFVIDGKVYIGQIPSRLFKAVLD